MRGIEGVTLKLNTLGDGASREAWRAALVEHFSAHRQELSELLAGHTGVAADSRSYSDSMPA